jgi:hypothetical protein
MSAAPAPRAAGADINRLSYDQLVAWASNLAERTGVLAPTEN